MIMQGMDHGAIDAAAVLEVTFSNILGEHEKKPCPA
jgi:hypothetical protein